MWVKVCGTTSSDDAQLAIEAGADALGFIFASSPRQVTPAQVAAMTDALPSHIETYGVFVHSSFEQIVATVEAAHLTGIQLHGNADPAMPRRLRAHFAGRPDSPRLGILRVLHYSAAAELDQELDALQQDDSVEGVLIDSRTATAVGGTGQTFDWKAASQSFRRIAPRLRLVAAGGLSPDNVAEAISTLSPWGVDVVTGVERSPGHKDPARVRAFIEAARNAALAANGPRSLRNIVAEATRGLPGASVPRR